MSLIAWPGGARSGGSAWDVSLPLTVAVGAAVETVLFKYLRVGRALLAVAGWQLVLGALPLLALSVLTGDASIRWTWTFVAALAFVALPGTAVGLALWYWLVQRESVSRLAGFMFLVPVAGLLLALAPLDETVSPLQGWGLGLALAGILLPSGHDDGARPGPVGRVEGAVPAPTNGVQPSRLTPRPRRDSWRSQ